MLCFKEGAVRRAGNKRLKTVDRRNKPAGGQLHAEEIWSLGPVRGTDHGGTCLLDSARSIQFHILFLISWWNTPCAFRRVVQKNWGNYKITYQ